MVPVEVLVKVTDSPCIIVVGVAVKLATGAGSLGSVGLLLPLLQVASQTSDNSRKNFFT